MGLADFSVPDSDLDRSVRDLCQNLLRGAPSAQRLSKHLAAKVAGTMYDDLISDILVPLIVELTISDDALEGMAAFWPNVNLMAQIILKRRRWCRRRGTVQIRFF